MKPVIGEYQSVVRNIRKEVILAGLCLGQTCTRLTHSYIFLGEEQPQCLGCDAPFTVRHFFSSVANLHKQGRHRRTTFLAKKGFRQTPFLAEYAFVVGSLFQFPRDFLCDDQSLIIN